MEDKLTSAIYEAKRLKEENRLRRLAMDDMSISNEKYSSLANEYYTTEERIKALTEIINQ